MKSNFIFLFCLTFSYHVNGQLSLESGTSNYLIDFDATIAGVNDGPFLGDGFSTSTSNGQLDADAWATTGLSDGSKPFGVSNTTGDHARGSSSGGVSSGGFYGFDIGGGNRAIGIQPSGSDWTPGTLSLKIDNNTNTVISEMDITYVIYVRNDQNRASSFNFSISDDNIVYQNIAAGEFTSPGSSTGDSWIPNNISIQLSGLQIDPNASYYIRWEGDDASGSGSRDELALDDISISIMGGPPMDCVEPSAQPTNLNFGTITTSSIQASFSASMADKYLIIQSTNANLGAAPIDMTMYNVGDNIGSGAVIQYANNTNFQSTGLTDSTTYYYFIFASNDNCLGGPDYLSSNPLIGSAMTQVQGNANNYYNSIGPELCSEELKTALYNLIDGHDIQTYGSLWTHYQSTDAHLNDAGNETIVWDMYSDNPTGPENEFTFGTEQCGNFQQEGDCYNREHSFPKSWWGGSTSQPQYTDMFVVVPSDGWVNGLRGNHPFGEVQDGTIIDESNNGCKLGTSEVNIPGYSGPVFEPTDPYKGDFARGYFYLATRYQGVIASWENSNTQSNAVLDGTSFEVFEPWVLDLLMSWHNQDPVSQKELDRNAAIFAIQGNRNPFIDHPEFVEDIWGDCEGSAIDSCIYVYKLDDVGPGSLRSAIACAENNDTISFSPEINNALITVSTGSIIINKNITIDARGNNSIMIFPAENQAPFIASIFKIENGATVNLINFKIEGASGPEGSAICNDGILSLKNMTIGKGDLMSANNAILNKPGSILIYQESNNIY